MAFLIVGPAINEASGIADSETNPGYLWVEEDSGNPPQVILLGKDGKVAKKIPLSGGINRDWEDLAIAHIPGHNGPQLHIAETGDNSQKETHYAILRFPEPAFAIDTVRSFENIVFAYADGSHDAEAILIDEPTGDIYIITKREVKSKIYKLKYPQLVNSVDTARFVGELPYSGVVSAATSVDGKELIIKTYGRLYYYTRSGKSIYQALQTIPLELPYEQEPLGEAVAFARDRSGIYTLSERGLSFDVKLYFYKRK